MRLRYKKTGTETSGDRFNIHAMAEVQTHDDTIFFSDLDVFIEAKQEWKDFRQALKDHDIINDNYNTTFFEPANEEDRKRGYTLW